jgi:hypothetical protein
MCSWKVVFFSLLVVLFIKNGSSQILDGDGLIPIQYQVKWNEAGLLPSSPTLAYNVFFVDRYSGTDYGKITQAITAARSTNKLAIILFSARVYNINHQIALSVEDSNLVFQGAGSTSTFLYFNFANDQCVDCFYIYGGTDTKISLSSDIPKFATTITVANNFVSGDWVRILEENHPNSSHYCGQISRVKTATSSSITLLNEANKTYYVANTLSIQKINPVRNIGFENLKIKRTTSGVGKSSTIRFDFAANCWVNGVELEYAKGRHITITNSAHIKVSGCFMHHATDYSNDSDGCGGTDAHGYGTVVARSNNCLIENNIFQRCRHAIIVAEGANCNVINYNYARDQYWVNDGIGGDLAGKGGDINVHGAYAYANLFEQNYCNFIHFDNSQHDWNGPYNALLRNKVADFTEDECGITIESSPLVAVLGNDIIHPDGPMGGCGFRTEGNVTLSKDIFGCADWGCVKHKDACDYSDKLWAEMTDVSYYYSARPEFVSANYTFPSLGPKWDWDDGLPPPTRSIPAKERFGYSVKTYNPYPTHYLFDSGWNQRTFVCDLNNDGNTDLLSVEEQGNSYAWLCSGSSFTYAGQWGNGHGNATEDRLGDFNNDGRMDITQFAASGKSYVWLSTGTAFDYRGQWGSDQAPLSTLLLGDFNTDGRTDVVQFTATGKSYVWISTGSTFSFRGQWGSSHGDISLIKIGDFNNDGRDDVAKFTADGNSYVWLSTGAAFSYAGQWGNGHGSASQVLLADFNADGKDDVAQFTANGNSYVWLSTGTAFSYSGQWGNGHGNISQVKIGDYNGDGKDDVAQFTETGISYVWTSTGSTFTYRGQWGSGHGGISEVRIADFNNDNKDDVVQLFSNGDSYVWTSDGTQFVYRGQWGYGQGGPIIFTKHVDFGEDIAVNDASTPEDFSLGQNYPNPFNATTIIRFAIPADVQVKIVIYNMMGQAVKTVLDRRMPSGYHQVEFNGEYLASGVYVCAIQAGNFYAVKKMILVK